jgi:SPOR domain
MSMADDRLRAQRPNERRGGRPADDSSGDPLAELARLIGQSDPFTDHGRRDGRDSAPRNSKPSSDWRRTAASMAPYDSSDEPARASSRSEQRFAEQDSYRDSYRQDPYRAPEEEPRHDPRYEERPSQYRREPHFADDEYHPREDERAYAAQEQGSTYFEDDAPLSAQEDDAYDDPPRTRRRGGLFTAVTLIGCAMIGTAGAYGYRTYYSGSGANRVPPVISAETSPTKVVSASEGPTGKFIQDRVRDVAPPERVVSREEEPLEIRPSSSGRGVSQSSQSGGWPSGGSGSSANSQGSANSADTKRVRTLTIRPDGAEPPARQPSGNQPSAATPPKQAPAPKAASRAPISLDPQEPSSPPSAPPAPRERVAAVPPPTTTQGLQPPAPRAPALASEASGGYSVQLSSQRSEAEAQASYKALQGKFPDQLSDRAPIIKRADLGSKGIYFRALVGPFGSSDEAASFCTELKAAGGQCFIQRN